MGKFIKLESVARQFRIIAIEDDYVNEGDIIAVREYIGLFGETFFIFVDKNE